MTDPKLQQIVQRMVEAGESEQDIALVIQHYKSAPATQGAQPSTRLESKTGHPLARLGYGLVNLVRENPSAVGAMAGGAIAAPFTGGLSAIPAIATVGGASAAGSGIGQALSGRTPDIKEMVGQGVAGAAGQGVGMGVAKGAQLLGRGLYRAAALPISKMGKYGDLIDEGLKNRVPVSKSGVEKAEGIKASRIATKKAAVAEADEKVTFRAGAIADDARGKLGPKVEALKDAGEEVGAAYDGPLARFAKRHPEGVSPSKLEGVKGTLDDRLGGAYRKVRMREPLTPKETGRMELSQAASRAQESVIPNYRDMNRGVMNAEGLRQMISRRVSPGNSGGNQGLENALTLLGGPSAIPARIAMLPPVLSRAGIAANEVGQVAEPTAPTLLRALLAMLASDEQRDQ